MASKKSSSGLSSSAGIMRYFDTEDTKIGINPKTVVISAVFIAIVLVILNFSI
ncbi:MAG: preprotein translocase subunit Sec61beta [Candidatus Methanoliparum thermophilum]|uniref:Preprotein translocase subunit SecG n=2 Tax=Candidatus Methanoliparum TaxID=2545692 RepID=A0A520KSN3_METT2|nr:MAG: preprotein translocase subunit Sec61beta [Candidatus Methanoliparum thermophilum]